MASDDRSSGDNQRQWPRQRCGTQCALVIDGMESGAYLLDASRGGFKLRFEQAEAAMAAISPPPRDIILSGDFTKMHATVMWASNGLAGCRFYQHLSLDEVVGLMQGVGRFRIRVVPLVPPTDEEARAEDGAEGGESDPIPPS